MICFETSGPIEKSWKKRTDSLGCSSKMNCLTVNEVDALIGTLSQPIGALDLSESVLNELSSMGLEIIRDVASLSRSEIPSSGPLGRKSINEIAGALEESGLRIRNVRRAAEGPGIR